ncbi:MAG: hypothetical protein E7422_03370 [Ruminococcaceae bacterium]|jgi:hypothetical protein|nr:hypothetical protein [Oscillospiraceae bacterium]
MQLSNGRKAFYITISILISFVFWFYVNNSASVDYVISDIPVEFINSESALANKGLMLISGNDATVDLELVMPRSMVYDFDTERVRLIADLNSINTTGTQSLTYSITGVDTSRITVKSPTIRTISVRVGELFRRNDVDIRCKLVGNVADGFVAGSVQLLPSKLEIWGQQSDVMQVSYAQVTLNIENARSTIVELLEFELYDYNDKLIENKNIHSSSDAVQVTMPVISATDIPLVVSFEEEPGIRKESFDYSLDVTSVTLSGDANLLAQVKEIELGRIALSEIENERTFTYEIPVPDGLTNLSGVTSATLTIKNRDIVAREMAVTKFSYENFEAEDRKVEVVTSSLNVVLRGTAETLEKLTEESVTAVADLSGVNNASGTYTVPAEIRVDGGYDVGTAQSFELTVRIEQAEAPADAGTDTESEPEAAEGKNDDADSNG